MKKSLSDSNIIFNDETKTQENNNFVQEFNKNLNQNNLGGEYDQF